MAGDRPPTDPLVQLRIDRYVRDAMRATGTIRPPSRAPRGSAPPPTLSVAREPAFVEEPTNVDRIVPIYDDDEDEDTDLYCLGPRTPTPN